MAKGDLGSYTATEDIAAYGGANSFNSTKNIYDTVVRRTSTTHMIEVNVDPMSYVNDNDEVAIVVNGRVVKRYSKFQALRAGLVITEN